MTDTMLSPVPQPQAPVRASQPPARAATDVKESEADQGFKNMLRSRMEPEPTSGETVDTGPETQAKRTDSAESVAEALPDDGKALPPAGKPGEALLAVLTANAQVGEMAETAPNEAVAVELNSGAAAFDLLDAETLTKPDVQNVIGVLPGQAGPDIHARPQRAPWTSAARSGLPNTELPTPIQTALGHTVREAMLGAEANLEYVAVEGRPLSALLPHAAGLDAVVNRLASADAQLTTPVQAGALGTQSVLPQDTLTGPRSALPTATLDTPLRQPGWDQALSERVMWVVNQKVQGVELKLNPAHLGPIEVRVQMQNDQAQVSFVAQHAPVREALEAALPRLREMFSANGFNLVDVNVSQHSFAQQERHARTAGGGERSGFGTEDEADLGDIAQPDRGRSGALPRGGVDLFA